MLLICAPYELTAQHSGLVEGGTRQRGFDGIGLSLLYSLLAGACFVGWQCRSYKDLKAFAAFARSPPGRISVMSELTCQTTLKINKINPPGTSARKANHAASEHNKTVLTMPAP